MLLSPEDYADMLQDALDIEPDPAQKYYLLRALLNPDAILRRHAYRYWSYNRQGYLKKIHQQEEGSLF